MGGRRILTSVRQRTYQPIWKDGYFRCTLDPNGEKRQQAPEKWRFGSGILKQERVCDLVTQPATESAKNAPAKLDSWKEIADFLHRGVRTVQRWERTEALPVRRHKHLKRGSVFAFSSDLEQWLRGRQLGFRVKPRSDLTELQDLNHQIVDQFRRLRALSMQQATLAMELRQLLAAGALGGAFAGGTDFIDRYTSKLESGQTLLSPAPSYGGRANHIARSA